MPTLTLPSGISVPVLGQGTWKMGERRERPAMEVPAFWSETERVTGRRSRQ